MRNNVLSALRISSGCTLAGWGMVHLFWDAPYRTFLWSEALFGWFVQGVLGITWTEYASSMNAEIAIRNGIRSVGVLLLITAIVALAKRAEKARALLVAGSAGLFTVALMLYKESGFQIAELIEQAGQFSSPFLLFLALSGRLPEKRILLWIKAAIALTFFGHGLYAIGYYPVPGNFVDMTINILGVREAQARELLHLAGIMDILVAICIFIPRMAVPALAYAFVWGSLTSLARPVSHLFTGNELSETLFWCFEGIRRTPHAGLPLAALLLSAQKISLKLPVRWARIPTA